MWVSNLFSLFRSTGTLSGEETLLFFIFASHRIRGQLLKIRICSPQSKFFFKSSPYFERAEFVPESKQKVKKVVPFVKLVEKPGDVSIHLKHLQTQN